ncbi:MAG: DUF1573 domain-containing protein [Gemmataceae bacterium]|nr:DUF1573 domain-containing protein [Gemmataceae bacterium]
MRWTLAISLIAALLGIALGVGLTWAELGPYALAPAQLTVDMNKLQPRAEVVGNATYDFGYMEQDARGSHTFEIRNTGEAPLKLAKGATSCKCTLSNLDHDTVQPGESAKIVLEWTASSISNDPRFRHSATIRTSDPRRPHIDLWIEGEVSRSHKLVPLDLRLPAISVGEGATAELDLYGYHGDKLTIKRQEYTDSSLASYFELRTEEMPAEQVKQERGATAGKILHVTIKPGLPLGPLLQRIRLWLDLPGDPIVEIPIEGHVSGDISIVGPRTWDSEHSLLVLGEVQRDKGAESKDLHLLVKGEHRDKIELKVVDVRPEFLQVEFEKPQSVEGAEVVKIPFTIKVPRGAPTVDHSVTIGKAGQIELETGHPTTPRLQIHVSFAVGK